MVARMELALLKLAQRIREEFEERPDLRVTVDEASRFWALDPTTCEEIFARLGTTGFLAKGPDERYIVRGGFRDRAVDFASRPCPAR